MATGENAGTWGNKTNSNLNLIQQAIAGHEEITLTDGSTTALLMANAAISTARNMIIKFATISLTSATTVTIPDGIEKFYIFDCTAITNPTNLTIKTEGGDGFTIDAAKIYAAYTDGEDLTEVSLDTLGGSIATAHIDDDAITSAKIADNAVLAANISAAQVTTEKIAEEAILTDRIANDAVTAAKLQRKFTISTSNPSGGSNGDIWLQYS